ncbi:MAG: FUSC family protein, partial [Dongiaceae bacterium]
VLVLWRTHPYQPGRIALAASYEALAIYTEDIVRLTRQDSAATPSARLTRVSSWDVNATEHRSRVRREIEATRQIVAVLGRARPGLRPTLERQLLLAEYADRHFAALIAFADLLESRLMQPGATSAEIITAPDIRPLPVEPLACLALLFRQLAEIIPQDIHGVSQRRQDDLAAINAQLVEKTRLAHERLQQHAAAGDSSLPIFEHLLDTLLTCAEGVQGVLLDTQFAASGIRLPEARQRTGFGARLAGLVAEARGNLTWQSVSFRHGLRVAVTVTIALYLTLAFQFGHGYWLTMTTLLILQPYVGSTWQTALQRMVGSVAGAVLAAFLVTVITDPLATSIAIFPLSIGTNMFRALDYGLYTFFLTPQFVLIAGLANPEQADASLAWLRALDSVLGGVLALAASFLLWPNREARQLPLQVANAITANRLYLQQVAMAKSRPQVEAQAAVAAVDASRRQAGLGSNNAEAALQRWQGEPGHERLPAEAVMALITAARRLAGTATTLWLSPAAFPADRQVEIRRRIDWVAEALGAIAEAVRHRQPAPALSPAPPLAELELGADTNGALFGNVLMRLYLQIDIMQEALQRLAAARKADTG